MLLPGEVEDLSRAVEKLCGYRANTIEEIKIGIIGFPEGRENAKEETI